ncbi:MAG: HlyC/CorC family transporter [Gammaproteobacteria bacterium]|nr:HlyC/CorC family transporter [Gammaproteobacteria bacterium]
MDLHLLLLLLLICISAFFSGAEIAFTSLSPAKTRTFRDDKRFASKAIVRLKNRPESLLITILLGNNLSNILATVVATLWGIKVFGNTAIGIVTGFLTFFILIFGEITPKTLAQKYAEGFSRFMAYPLLWLTYILWPIIWLLEKFIHSLMKIFNAQNPIQSMSEKELLALVDIGTKEGVIEEHEQEFIENVLEFTDTIVAEIMTHEKDIEALSVNTRFQDAVKFFVEHSHSRIPIYKDDIDNIVGVITVHDILRLTCKSDPINSLADFHFNPVVVVPKTKSISKLFQEFQIRRQHLAIVVDEHGETVGIVTLEDILVEIVGDIVDEQDREFKKIYQIGKNCWEAFGEATIEQVNDALDIELDYPEHQTISLLILEQLQRFPKQGEKIGYGDLVLQVKAMGKNRIEKVTITPLTGMEDNK